MTNTRRTARGFTLLELMTVVAITLVVAALGVYTFGRQTPRSRLDSTALELRALLFGARQQALTSGRTVAVLFFPGHDPRGWTTGVGRVIVYEDGAGTLFSSAAAVHFDAYDPAAPAVDVDAEVLEVVDMPRGVRLTQTGATSTAVAPPLDGIVLAPCDFCGDDRGAIAFDSQGRATFHDGDGPALLRDVGSSFAVEAEDIADERRILFVLSRTGAVQTVSENIL